jgi:hypothetical protein
MTEWGGGIRVHSRDSAELRNVGPDIRSVLRRCGAYVRRSVPLQKAAKQRWAGEGDWCDNGVTVKMVHFRRADTQLIDGSSSNGYFSFLFSCAVHTKLSGTARV